jgi:multimeric flavodoxin WrbA
MKALVLDGSESDASPLSLAADKLVEWLIQTGREPIRARLRDLNIASCKGCFQCWNVRPGLCGIQDDAEALTQCLAQSDTLVIVTPVSFGGVSSVVKCALERVALPVLLPIFDRKGGETHHPTRYENGVRLLAVGAMTEKDVDSENVFRSILKRNAKNFQSADFAAAFVYDRMTPAEVEELVNDLAAKTLAASGANL